MDKTDLEMLSILSKDARTPFVKIAKKLGIGEDSVCRRFKKLQDDGVILFSTVVLDFQACGFEGLCGLLIKTSNECDLEVLKSKLRTAPNAFLIAEMWGDYEFYIESYFKSYPELLELIRYLQNITGVLNIDTMLFTRRELPIPSDPCFYVKDAPYFTQTHE